MTLDSGARRADGRLSIVTSAADDLPARAQGIFHLPDYIDLHPLLASPAATEMLLLARGQLNSAFRKHGLAAPDPLLAAELAAFDTAELDNPAAGGLERATGRFGEAFTVWAARMPAKLAQPVLDILRQTHAGLSQRPDGAAAGQAVLEAYTFLLRRSQLDQGGSGTIKGRPAPCSRPASQDAG